MKESDREDLASCSGHKPDQFDQLVRRSLLDLRSLGEGGGKGVTPAWQPKEIPLGDGRTLVLEDS